MSDSDWKLTNAAKYSKSSRGRKNKGLKKVVAYEGKHVNKPGEKSWMIREVQKDLDRKDKSKWKYWAKLAPARNSASDFATHLIGKTIAFIF